MNDSSNNSNEIKKISKNQKIVGIGLFLVFAAFFIVLSLRLFYIAVGKNVNHNNLVSKTQQLYTQTQTLKARRGSIYDSDGQPIAEDTSTYSMYAILDKGQAQVGSNNHPLYVTNKTQVAKVLSKYLPISEKKAYQYLNPNGHPFQVQFGSASQNISLMTKKSIDNQHLNGIHFIQQQARLYPNGVFSSNLIGLASPKKNSDGGTNLVGQIGIEQAFNKYLSGTDGFKAAEYDVRGYLLPGRKQEEKPVKNGDDVYTTLDSRLQILLESEMDSVVSQVHPKSMNAILMDAKTGKIVAASQRPTFNAQTLSGISNAWTNNLVQGAYEPGSTMKVFTLASAIDSGNFDGQQTYLSGRYSVDGKIVPDWDTAGWGYITYDKGFALSSNVAMAHLEQKMGPKTWKKYLHRFDFLKSTNSGLVGEQTGKMQFQYPIEQADTAFGQGIEVTPMQMMQGLTAISNNGKMMKPYFLSKIVSPNGKIVKKYGPTQIGQPIKASTAQAVRQHMQDVVYKSYGIGQDYKISGYRVAAKTGTAQVSNGQGSYASGDDSYLYSVAGMVPANNPRYVMFITMGQPTLTGLKTPTQLLAEIFKPVMVRALQNTGTTSAKVKVTVPSVAFNTLDEAKTTLSQKGLNVVTVGNGSSVIKQIAAAGSKAYEGSRVFILTNGNWYMPKIIGWSKADVTNLCKLTGMKLEATGSGFADSQSIAYNQHISGNMVLKANFE